MRIRSAVANAVVRWAAQRASAPAVGSAWAAGQPIWSEWSAKNAITEGYKRSHIVYAVGSDLADCVGSVPWVVKRDGEIVDKGPLVDMLRMPNQEMPWSRLCEATDLYKSLAGNAYILQKPIADKVRLWILRPDRVTPVPDKNGHLLKYEYRLGGKKTEEYKPEEILHFTFFDPGSDLLGMSPLQAASRIVDTSNSLVEWNKESLGNRAKKDVLMSPKNSLTVPQHSKLLELIRKQLSGPKKAHGVLLPSEPMEVTELALSPAELDFIKSFVLYERAVCEVFHVQPEAVGIGDAKYENKKWAIQAKWEGPIESRLREMRSVINHKLAVYGTSFPAQKGGLYLDYDLSGMPAAVAARTEAAEIAKGMWAMGVPWDTLDEKLDLGIGSVDGGDVGYIPATLLPTTSSGARSSRAVNSETDDQLAAGWRVIDQRKQGWERGVEIKVLDQLGADRKAAVKAIEAGSKVVVDRAAWDKLITTIMRAVIKDFGTKQADDLAGRAASYFDPWSTESQRWVKEHGAEHVKSITSTTMDMIKAATAEGLAEGLALPKVAKQVGEAMSLAAKGRASIIARTEVHTAAGFGMREAAKQSKIVTKKMWMNSGDERVRDLHIDNSGAGWIPLDEPYPSGAMFPGDGGPEDTIGCRCAEAYETR